ncbi:MAG: hypothetical protein GX640_12720, partial [Fibrobacter sp.]|nr:hypothetical protein [Fibrobacter sp.]
SFNYDPDASTNFTPKQSFAFSGDTLIVHDYWALADQPELGCSLSVSNDTLSLFYVFEAGLVKDWMPTVETVIKIRVGGIVRTIVCCLNEVKNYARKPQSGEPGFRDATVKHFVAVPVPPLVTYKYRAHSNPNAMVYLSYLEYGAEQWVAPQVTVSLNDTLDGQETDATLAALLAEELQWLKERSICNASDSSILFLKKMIGSGGGWGYWTKQDTLIPLGSWFTVYNHVLSVNGIKRGCGLGTDFILPGGELVSVINSGKEKYQRMDIQNSIVTRVVNGTLTVSSHNELFKNISVYDITGRQIYENRMHTPVNSVSVFLEKLRCSHGRYMVRVGVVDGKVSSFNIVY